MRKTQDANKSFHMITSNTKNAEHAINLSSHNDVRELILYDATTRNPHPANKDPLNPFDQNNVELRNNCSHNKPQTDMAHKIVRQICMDLIEGAVKIAIDNQNNLSPLLLFSPFFSDDNDKENDIDNAFNKVVHMAEKSN